MKPVEPFHLNVNQDRFEVVAQGGVLVASFPFNRGDAESEEEAHRLAVIMVRATRVAQEHAEMRGILEELSEDSEAAAVISFLELRQILRMKNLLEVINRR